MNSSGNTRILVDNNDFMVFDYIENDEKSLFGCLCRRNVDV